jgi:hypothetical protein
MKARPRSTRRPRGARGADDEYGLRGGTPIEPLAPGCSSRIAAAIRFANLRHRCATLEARCCGRLLADVLTLKADADALSRRTAILRSAITTLFDRLLALETERDPSRRVELDASARPGPTPEPPQLALWGDP